MRQIFLSFQNGYQLFCKNKIHGFPIEKCNIENLRRIQKKGYWLKNITEPIPELQYFKFFQYSEEMFPGLSIIRAHGKKIKISDDYSYFLGDFMTVDGFRIVGGTNISESETEKLTEEILKTFDYFGFSVVRPGQILVWFAGKYPFINWKYPHQLVNLNYKEHLPTEGSLRTLVRIIENSYRLIEKHPVNKVRIDLAENPANFLWFHSQNRKAEKALPLTKKTKKKTIFWSNTTKLNDIALYLGFEISEHIPLNTDELIIWINIDPQTYDLIDLMHKCEFIDKEIISSINETSDRLVIEFNDGFYNKKYSLYFLYPAEKIGFFKKLQLIKKTPGNFLFAENG